MFNRELKKGSVEFLILSLIEARPRHGYDIGKLIEARSKGRIRFRIGSLYPILCRLEERNLIAGRWVEKTGERRRTASWWAGDSERSIQSLTCDAEAEPMWQSDQ